MTSKQKANKRIKKMYVHFRCACNKKNFRQSNCNCNGNYYQKKMK